MWFEAPEIYLYSERRSLRIQLTKNVMLKDNYIDNEM